MGKFTDRLKDLEGKMVLTEESTIHFGKWKGQRVDHIMTQDPGWLLWAAGEGIILFDDDTHTEIQKNLDDMNDNKNYRED